MNGRRRSMLKGIPDILPPELLKTLDEMGHGDRIVIGDINFPARSIADAGSGINIRCDGQRGTDIVDAVLQLMPLDAFVEKSVIIMDKPAEHRDLPTPVWKEFEQIVAKYDERGKDTIEYVDRFAFYALSKKAYATVSTSEKSFYACIILQKGCI